MVGEIKFQQEKIGINAAIAQVVEQRFRPHVVDMVMIIRRL